LVKGLQKAFPPSTCTLTPPRDCGPYNMMMVEPQQQQQHQIHDSSSSSRRRRISPLQSEMAAATATATASRRIVDISNNNNSGSRSNSELNISTMNRSSSTRATNAAPVVIVDINHNADVNTTTATHNTNNTPAPIVPIKPIAMKVLRPIPKRMSEQYYQQAYQHGLTLQETNQAAIIAHEWHRKWTQQDEQDHTTPDADFYDVAAKDGSKVPAHYNNNKTTTDAVARAAATTTAADVTMYASSVGSSTASTTSSRKVLLAHALELDRLRGAKNPSLGDSVSIIEDIIEDSVGGGDYELQHGVVVLDEERFKRARQVVYSADRVVSKESSLSLEDDTMPERHHAAPLLNPKDRLSDSYSSSSSSGIVGPRAKRRFFGSASADKEVQDDEPGQDDDEYDISARAAGNKPLVVAPFPVRPAVVRPKAMRFDDPRAHPAANNAAHLIRPTPIAPPTRRGGTGSGTTTNKGVPKNVIAYGGQQLSVSPMSYSPGVSPPSSRSSGSFLASPPPTATLDQQQQQQQQMLLQDESHVVHVVEDDEENDYQVSPKIGSHIAANPLDDDDDDMSRLSMSTLDDEVQQARDDVLQALAVTGGEVSTDHFKATVDPLEKYFSKQDLDTRPHVVGTNSIAGMWLTLSKPNFFGCLGQNENGDPMYTLGRMSFDMFSPTNLVCSLQGNFNPVEVVTPEERKGMLDLVPKSLRDEVESGTTVLRTYHVVTAFTIEPSLAEFPNAPNKDVYRPIKGIMTTYGYSLPDPNTPNRHSIWFTGGRIEPNDDPRDIKAWKNLFTLHPPKHSFGEKAKLLAVKLLMGATVPEEVAEDGSMEYTFTRPLGGHGMAYIDVIYLDNSMRIVRGHRGTTFVFSRMPNQDPIQALPTIDDSSVMEQIVS
jgi:hypothetical protein